ncbi:hypothetical protein HYG77_32425 (plasmid) [Rhodococcus sp. ZPP]|uniref:hypothetical protein n=1 Tax=Rhodococcus sp. ZPP TaxID=2749906 RepID=UPI001AD87EB5|nr:hypothetical protein [Rhodococcus sp. ZPP]QTJ70271.1 hypothetical protein HYG77_32425 [Rhodococcus sp. ZPP]
MSVHETMAEIAHSPSSAEEMWIPCGPAPSIADLSAAMKKSWMDGDISYVELARADLAGERISQHDDAQHLYPYDYLDGPLVLDALNSRFHVTAPADGDAEIFWSAQLTAVSVRNHS